MTTMSEDRTTEECAADFTAMGHSISLITDVIAGDAMAEEEAADRQDCVDRNVAHLEIMKAKTWFSDGLTDQQETDVDAAIAAGKAYSA